MPLAPDLERGLLERPAARLRLHVIDEQRRNATFDDLATEADLHRIGSEWVEINADQAHAVLAQLLHRDMAYQAEVMPLSRATSLATALIAYCGVGARFATNTSVETPFQFGRSGRSFMSATDATFDCGVLIIGERACAVYWIEDED